MRLAQAPLLLVLVAGCAAVTPDVPVAPGAEVVGPQPTTAAQPEVVAPHSTAPRPAATASTPATRAASQPVPAVTTARAAPAAAVTEKKSAVREVQTPAAAIRPPAAAASSATAEPAAQTPAAMPPPATPPALDLNALKAQLKETKAIGVLTKLSLKNQVDDLLQQFRDFYQGKAKVTMAQLRRSYDLLLMKVLSLVQDADQKLASAIVASREAIWGLLADPKKFATLET